ncbi:MAG: T9SS type A sorting domain-containing protein [Bacteroidota bacterium]
MKKKILSYCCCVLGLGATTLYAQVGINASGGNAGGTGGTASFSVGQIFYTTTTSSSNRIDAGVQQPWEIYTDVNEKAPPISLTASVFPNPMVDNFTLKVELGKLKNPSFELYNSQGSILLSKHVDVEETPIDLGGLASSYYILRVYDGKQSLKTFKIIKN